MTVHAFHRDILAFGLSDDCDRCTEIAENPVVRLDRPNLDRLADGHLFTETDRRAAERLGVLREDVVHQRAVVNRSRGWAGSA